jgi:hypothetical protein
MADGFHRFLAAGRIGSEEITCDVRTGTKTDALWFALGANRQNGTRLNIDDKRHAILVALQTWPDYSTTRIAEQIGCDQSTAMRVKQEVMQAHNLPSRVIGKDGKSYPAVRTARIDTPSEPTTPSTMERRREMATEGATASGLKRLPRKEDGEIMTRAVAGLESIISGLRTVAIHELATDDRAASWRQSIAEVIGSLRLVNKRLGRRDVV